MAWFNSKYSDWIEDSSLWAFNVRGQIVRTHRKALTGSFSRRWDSFLENLSFNIHFLTQMQLKF
jgi:hypothetical protein